MADEADDAQRQEEFAMKMALKAMQGGSTLSPKGECYACEAPLDDGTNPDGTPIFKRLFCDLACSKDYDKQKNRR